MTDLIPVKACDLKKLERTLAAFYEGFGSELTKTEYRRAAKEFFSLIHTDLKNLGDLSRDHLILYQSYLKKLGKAPKTIQKKMAAISSLCKHLAHEGYVERDLSYGIKRPKAYNKKETGDFKDSDIEKIFSSMNPNRLVFTSHRAILAIGFYTGLRSAEIRTLKVGDIVELDGHRILRTKIKGDKPHEVPLKPFVYRAICEHIEKLTELGFKTTDPDQWLFPALLPERKNRPLTAQALRKILHHRLKDAGIPISSARRYSPHSMRATLASHLLNEKNVPLEDVQALLGHSSPTTTQKYNKRERSLDKSPVYMIDY